MKRLVLSLLVVIAVVAAALLHILPARTPNLTASGSGAGRSPSSGGSAAGPQLRHVASASTVVARPPAPAAAAPATPAPATVGATGGGPGAPVADLSALTPVQEYNVSGLSDGAVRIGATTYTDSVRFTCDSAGHESSGDLDYVVTGYGTMTATLGIPGGDKRAAPDTMSISFFNNGSGSQMTGPVTVTPGHPQPVRLTFRDSSQLEISCTAVNAATHSPEYMQLALANATIGPG
jgi:hypothetical protein